MRAGGCQVEVRKNAGSSTWYNATVLDIVGDNIRVEYEAEVWPAREAPADSVRHCPPAGDEADFQPKVGDVVEVALAATESNPSGWSLGRVKKIKNRVFYFVTFEGLRTTTQDIIVERDALRKVNESPPIDATGLVRRLVGVAPSLGAWIKSEDSLGCLADVAVKAKLLSSACTTARSDGKGPPKVAVVGNSQAVALAEKLLIEIHFKNQIQMQRFHDHREKLRAIIEQREHRHRGGCREVFEVESGLVGRLIGKKGENIQRIREELEVEILIRDGDANATITVTAANQDAVKKAREQLEYVTARIPVEEDKVGWVVGKGHQNLLEICKKADLVYARFDSRSSSIELMGLRAPVEDAKMMIDVHREYLDVYQDMSEERAAIQQQFAELEKKQGKGKKGSGFEKGGGKGGYSGKGYSEKGSGKQALSGGGRGKGGRYEEEDDYYRGPSKGGYGGGGYGEEGPPLRGKGKGKSKDSEGGGKDSGGKGGKKGGKSKGKGKDRE